MQITLDSQRLYQAASIARQVVTRKTTLPVTNYISVESKSGKVTATATNLEQLVIIELKGHSDTDGQFFLPIAQALSFSRYEKGEITLKAILEKTSTKVELIGADTEGGRCTVVLHVDNKMEMPTKMGEVNLKDMMGLPLNFPLRLAYAHIAAATEDSRPVLRGVCFAQTDESFDMASADGFRLITVSHPKLRINPANFNIVVPLDCAVLVAKNMKGLISFGCDVAKNKAWFSNADMTVITQLIQGTYPKYQSLIPQAAPTWTFSVSAPVLAKRLNQLSKDTTVTRLTSKDKSLVITERTESMLEARTNDETVITVPATTTGEGKIAVNKAYLVPVAKIFAEMTVEVTSPSAPMKIKGDLDGVTLVIMPMYVMD